MKAEQESLKKKKVDTLNFPTLARDCVFAEQFLRWISSNAGGGRTKSYGEQIVSRTLKFLKFCQDEFSEDDLLGNSADYYVGTVENIRRFLELLEKEHNASSSCQLGYINSLFELIDYRKFQGLSAAVLQNFSIVEIYLRRVRKCFSKKQRIHWNTALDIDTLENKGHWATMQELQQVIPFQLSHYNKILTLCKTSPRSVLPTDLTFATRFIAMFLFLNVQGTRPMTYQYLTLEIIDDAKQNAGFVAQKKFKTADHYVFDSFNLQPTSLRVIQGYRKHVRPLLMPTCDFLLVNRNGAQFSKLTEALGKLVFDAIGKCINPTRYRQIIETESSNCLDNEEQEWISEIKKHSSHVARICYQKKRSRNVALKGQGCLKKLCGEDGEQIEKQLECLFTANESDEDDIFITQKDREDSEESSNECTPNIEPTRSPPKSPGLTSQDKIYFTVYEDHELTKGLKKYGKNNWTSILRDSDLHFAKGRTADALKKRARSKAFSLNTKGMS